MIERQQLHNKLAEFISGGVPIDDMHAWALNVALGDDYPRIAEQDPLIKETIQALLDLDRKDLRFVPSRRILEYFRRCLEGTEEYSPPGKRGRLDHIIIDEPDKPASLIGGKSHVKTEKKKEKPAAASRPKKDISRLIRTFRRYTLVFAWGSIALNLAGALAPEALGFVVTESPLQLLIAALPHLIYALFVLVPVRILASGKIFLLSFVVAVFGAVMYCGMSVVFIVKFALPLIFALLVMPFAAIPSILMPIVLFYYRREHLRERAQTPDSSASAPSASADNG